VERIYALNPGLSLLGARIPAGTTILMPEDEPDKVAPPNRLWG
jgi:phage tail protein X